MIAGVGIDLIDLDHFEKHYGKAGAQLLARCFTEAELAACGEGVDRLCRLAARFAAKEAAYKAMGGIEGAALADVEVVRDGGGAPRLTLHHRAAEAAAERGIVDFRLSLTHSARSAAAVVIAVSGGR